MDEWSVREELDISCGAVRRVEVRIVGGDVAVTAGTGDTGRCLVRREEGPPLEVRLTDDGVLEVTHPDPTEGSLLRMLRSRSVRRRASVELTVPPSTKVEINTVSAPVVVAGLSEQLAVRTVSGDVVLDHLAGDVSVMTVSGALAARHVTGSVRTQTVSGSVAVAEGATASLRAQTVSGGVAVDVAHPQGDYSVQTVSGEVALRTPQEPDLLIEASSVSGELFSDLGLQWDGRRPGNRRMRTRLGSASARVRVRTVSGTLRIARRREHAA